MLNDGVKIVLEGDFKSKIFSIVHSISESNKKTMYTSSFTSKRKYLNFINTYFEDYYDETLKPLIENIGDATLIVPMIKEYMEIGVKNDEHLIKLATVVQRIEAIQARGGDGEIFDFSELQDLLEESEESINDVENTQENNDSVEE